MNQKVLLVAIAFAGILFSGCAGSMGMGGGGGMESNARMTQSIYLEPVSADKKSVYVNIKNTSGQSIHVKDKIESALKAKGYTLTGNASKATYTLTANVVNVGKSTQAGNDEYGIGRAAKSEADSAIRSKTYGYGNGAASDAVSNIGSSIVGGLIDKFTSDTVYEAQVEIIIKEKMGKKSQDHRSTLIVNVAKNSLTPTEANPALEDKIAVQIAEIF